MKSEEEIKVIIEKLKDLPDTEEITYEDGVWDTLRWIIGELKYVKIDKYGVQFYNKKEDLIE